MDFFELNRVEVAVGQRLLALLVEGDPDGVHGPEPTGPQLPLYVGVAPPVTDDITPGDLCKLPLSGLQEDQCVAFKIPADGVGRCANILATDWIPGGWDEDEQGWVSDDPIETPIGVNRLVLYYAADGDLAVRLQAGSPAAGPLMRVGCAGGELVFATGRTPWCDSRPVTDCALCPNGAPRRYQVSVTGGGGAFAELSGTYRPKYSAGCTWTVTTENGVICTVEWEEAGTGTRQMKVTVTDGTATVVWRGEEVEVEAGCCEPVVMTQQVSASGTGSAPALPTVTGVGPCAEEECAENHFQVRVKCYTCKIVCGLGAYPRTFCVQIDQANFPPLFEAPLNKSYFKGATFDAVTLVVNGPIPTFEGAGVDYPSDGVEGFGWTVGEPWPIEPVEGATNYYGHGRFTKPNGRWARFVLHGWLLQSGSGQVCFTGMRMYYAYDYTNTFDDAPAPHTYIPEMLFQKFALGDGFAQPTYPFHGDPDDNTEVLWPGLVQYDPPPSEPPYTSPFTFPGTYTVSEGACTVTTTTTTTTTTTSTTTTTTTTTTGPTTTTTTTEPTTTTTTTSTTTTTTTTLPPPPSDLCCMAEGLPLAGHPPLEVVVPDGPYAGTYGFSWGAYYTQDGSGGIGTLTCDAENETFTLYLWTGITVVGPTTGLAVCSPAFSCVLPGGPISTGDITVAIA